MQLVKVIIKNFLSIKEEQVLKLNNGITSIVGLNESGKTSILKAIEKLNGKKITKNEKNKSMKNDESYIYGIFKLTEDEIKNINKNIPDIYKYPEDITLYLKILIDDEDGIGYYILTLDDQNNYVEINLKYIEKIRNNLQKLIKNNNEIDINKLNELSTDKEIKAFLTNIANTNDISEEQREKINEIIEKVDSQLWIDYIPEYEIIKFSSFEDVLKEKFTIEEIEKDKKVQNIFKIAKIDIKEIKENIENNEELALQDIESKYVDIVTKKFKNIFIQVDDNFKLKIRIGSANKDITFSTQDKTTNTDSIPIDARSDGFKWYLSMYLTLYDYIENNDKNNKILLLDEPNLYLHAEAQKDLLNRVFKEEFKDLQIIYTTHSPYMIDASNTFSIRIVEKDDQTYIYNSTREYALTKEELKDVDALTPLMTALHLNVANELILDKNDNIIVVEGIQDVYVLKAMIEKLNYIKKFQNIKFVPCFGSEKVPYMFGYLYGLGYNTYILVDADKGGKSAYIQITNKENDNPLKDIVLTYGKTLDFKTNILLESLFSKNDKETLLPNKSTILYKNILDNVDNIDFEKETLDSFKSLLDMIIERVGK